MGHGAVWLGFAGRAEGRLKDLLWGGAAQRLAQRRLGDERARLEERAGQGINFILL